jgi:hypothetical protein
LGNLLILEYSGGILLATPTVLEGDYNRDGTVDAADYVVWRDQMGIEGNSLIADGNRNGEIDQADYDVWKSNFGRTSSANLSNGTEPLAVPEPKAAAMLVHLGVLVMLFSCPKNSIARRQILAGNSESLPNR